jgi:hypothetical protein
MVMSGVVVRTITPARNPIVLGCMALDMFAVIFAGATALLPVYATIGYAAPIALLETPFSVLNAPPRTT